MRIQVTGEALTDEIQVSTGQQARTVMVSAGLVSSVNGQTGDITGLARAEDVPVVAAAVAGPIADEAADAAVAEHVTAVDPHGDRAAAAADATAKVDAHTAATDPHGDRAYADNRFLPAADTGLFPVAGAAGDGSDDLTAFQAAVDQCSTAGGGTVVIPPGRTYGLANYLYIPSNVTIFAYGATIKAIGAHGLVRLYRPTDSFTDFNGHSHIQILGGVWDANASSSGVGTVVGVVNAFTLGHNSDILFRDVTIKNVASAHAIDITASRRVRIINCAFLGFVDNTGDQSRDFSEAIQIDAALASSGSIGTFDNTTTQDVLVENCYFGSSERLGPFGRAVGSHTSVSGDYYDNIQIVGNRIEGTRQEGIRAYAWRRAVIERNIITGTGTSGILITGPDPATAGYAITSHMVTVAGNEIEAPVTLNPIRVSGFATARPTGVTITRNTVISSPSTGIYISQADAPQITGNRVLACTSSSIYAINCTSPTITVNHASSAGGVSVGVETCTGGQVAANNVENAGGHGILVSAGSDVHVSGNRVFAANTSGIRATSSTTRARIMGNTVIRGGTTDIGLDVTASATDCIIIGNDLTGGGWTAAGATAFNLVGTRQMLDWSGSAASPGLNLAN